MARDHARIYLSIWSDPEFKALTIEAQRMYFVLLSQPGLRYCGAMDFLPGRLAKLAADETVQSVENAVKCLEDSTHIVLDRETCELLLRTYIRHDGILGSPNMVKAMLKDREHVISDTLRDTIDGELAKAFRADPKASGWKGFKAADPVLYERVSDRSRENPSRKGW